MERRAWSMEHGAWSMEHRAWGIGKYSGQQTAKRLRIDFDVLEFQWIVPRIELCGSSPGVVEIV